MYFSRKLWTFAEFKWKKIPDNLISLFNKSLDSDNSEFIKLVLKLLYLLTDVKSVRKNGQFKVGNHYNYQSVTLKILTR